MRQKGSRAFVMVIGYMVASGAQRDGHEHRDRDAPPGGGGLPHDHAKAIAEVLHDEVIATLPTRDFVELTVNKAKVDLVKWFSGIIVVQTLGLIGVFRLLTG